MQSKIDPLKIERTIDVCALGLSAILPFRAKDASDSRLEKVCIEKHSSGGVVISASNGHLLGIYYDESGSTSSRWTVKIPIEFQRDMKKHGVRRVKFDEVYGWSVSEKVKMNSLDEDEPPSVLFRTEKDYVFPKWNSVIPHEAQPCHDGIGIIDPKYFGMAMEAFKGAGAVRMYLSSRHSVPSIFRASGFRVDGLDYSNLVVVVMGIKDDTTWKDRIPEWLERMK